MEYVCKKFSELSAIEIERILRLRNDVFIVEQQCIYMDIDGKDETSQHLFAKEGDEIVACLRIVPPGGKFSLFSIGRIVVARPFRGQGISRKLMQIAFDFCNNLLHCEQVMLYGQVYIVPFYQSLGFRIVSDEYLEDGIWHVDMIKDMMPNGEPS